MKTLAALFATFFCVLLARGQSHDENPCISGEIAFEGYIHKDKYSETPWAFLRVNKFSSHFLGTEIAPTVKFGLNTAEKSSFDLMVGPSLGKAHAFISPMIGFNLGERAKIQTGIIGYLEHKKHEIASINQFWGGTYFSMTEYFFTLKEKEKSVYVYGEEEPQARVWKFRIGIQYEYLYPNDDNAYQNDELVKKSAGFSLGPLIKLSYGKSFLKLGMLADVSDKKWYELSSSLGDPKAIFALGLNL